MVVLLREKLSVFFSFFFATADGVHGTEKRSVFFTICTPAANPTTRKIASVATTERAFRSKFFGNKEENAFEICLFN